MRERGEIAPRISPRAHSGRGVAGRERCSGGGAAPAAVLDRGHDVRVPGRLAVRLQRGCAGGRRRSPPPSTTPAGARTPSATRRSRARPGSRSWRGAPTGRWTRPSPVTGRSSWCKAVRRSRPIWPCCRTAACACSSASTARPPGRRCTTSGSSACCRTGRPTPTHGLVSFDAGTAADIGNAIAVAPDGRVAVAGGNGADSFLWVDGTAEHHRPLAERAPTRPWTSSGVPPGRCC